MITLKLSKPINDGGPISELTFREPTAKDIIEAGIPYRSETDYRDVTSRKIDAKSMAVYIELLTNNTPFAVNQISASDFMKCNKIVMDFFSEVAEPSSS